MNQRRHAAVHLYETVLAYDTAIEGHQEAGLRPFQTMHKASKAGRDPSGFLRHWHTEDREQPSKIRCARIQLLGTYTLFLAAYRLIVAGRGTGTLRYLSVALTFVLVSVENSTFHPSRYALGQQRQPRVADRVRG